MNCASIFTVPPSVTPCCVANGIWLTIAASGGGGSTPAPASVTTTAGAFSQLQILAPGETAAPGTAIGKTGKLHNRVVNRAFNVAVNAVDAYWNPVSSTDTIAITSTDSAATLPANAALVAGTTNFAVTLNTVGSFNVTATNVSNGSITSGTTAVRMRLAPSSVRPMGF